MKKIINGKMYNTETATELAEWWNGCSTRDFRYCKEKLYKKKTGEFFLYGEGGPMSPYTQSCSDNSWTGAEKIIPYDETEAMEWAEEKLSADEYIAIFGEVEE